MPPPSRTRYNWPLLKIKWLQENLRTGLTLNQFRKREKIADTTKFYEHVRTEEWEKQRDALFEVAAKKTEQKIIDSLSSEWAEQEKLWDKVESHADRLLGKKRLKAKELDDVAKATQRSLVSRRLIKGKATEITELNYHALIVKLVEDVRKKNPHVIDVTDTIPELDPLPLPRGDTSGE